MHNISQAPTLKEILEESDKFVCNNPDYHLIKNNCYCFVERIMQKFAQGYTPGIVM
jgi:hypothetical protein